MVDGPAVEADRGRERALRLLGPPLDRLGPHEHRLGLPPEPLGDQQVVLVDQQSVGGQRVGVWSDERATRAVAGCSPVPAMSRVPTVVLNADGKCTPPDAARARSDGRAGCVMTDGGRIADGSDAAGDGDGDGADAGPATDPLVAVYRHDVHKLRHRRHDAAAESYAGVPVNEMVPLHADRDAALLSRPRGEPEQTVANHASPYRLSLLTGETAVETDRIRAAAGGGFRELVMPDDPELLHARWLTSEVAGVYSESVHYPYTSLQYHTLLTATLLHCYRAGNGFEDLWVVATAPNVDNPSNTDTGTTRDPASALAADEVQPHRTILWTPALALHVTPTPGDRPVARLGDAPARSFADVWSRLPAHPIDTDGGRRWRLLDAQLRRIRSWSTALAFIDEFVAAHGRTAGRGDGV